MAGRKMEPESLVSYSLAIIPPPSVALEVSRMKLELKAGIGKSYASVNAGGHISLDGFEAKEGDYPQVLAEYRRQVSGLSAFPVTFSGYGHFESYYPAFYVRLTDASADLVRSAYACIRNGFDKKLKRQYMKKWADESKAPHMTIGRRLTMEQIRLAYSIFPAFEAAFECREFAIRKFNPLRRQYEVADLIGLEGKDVVPGGQLSFL